VPLRDPYGIAATRGISSDLVARASRNVRTQMRLNYGACDFSEGHRGRKIVSRLIASATVLAIVTGLAGCAVAPGYGYPGYGYGYGYAQPYYPDYGYPYGVPYAPAYGSIGIYGGWGGSCCYYHGGHWHGGDGWHGGGWNSGHGGHGGWHGGGYGGSRGGGSSWSSGGGGHGGHGH